MMNRRKWIASMGAVPIAGGFLMESSAQQAAGTFQTVSSRERLRERFFPNVVLTTHLGTKVRFYDDLLKDKIVMINFMYAKCEGVCPGITTNLARVQKLLAPRVGRDIFMYSISLKPEEDTPMALHHYAQMHHAGPGWLFLTGKPTDIELLRRKLGFTNPDPVEDADKDQHIGMVRYGNEPLQQWGGCPGLAHASFIAESIGWIDWPKGARKGGQK
jgi:protein SCO1/2